MSVGFPLMGRLTNKIVSPGAMKIRDFIGKEIHTREIQPLGLYSWECYY